MIQLVILVAGALLLLTGCERPPIQELYNAKAAIQAARYSQADSYSPVSLKMAEDSLSVAIAEIKSQEPKLLRDYRHARSVLSSAIMSANRAKESVDGEKERIAAETESLLSDVSQLIAEAQKSINEAERNGKEVKTLRITLDSLVAFVQERRNAKESDNVQRAYADAQSAQMQLVGLISMIEALPAASPKKGRR